MNDKRKIRKGWIGNPADYVPKGEVIWDYEAEPGHEYRYRPGQILVHREDYERVADDLKRFKATPPVWDRQLTNIGVVALPKDVNIPALVRRVRNVSGEPQPRLGPNHVLRGEPVYHGGPGGPRRPSPEPSTWTAGKGGSKILMGVLDTGYMEHPDLGGIDFTVSDTDELDDPSDGLLDAQSGHGLFVSGLIRQIVPEARIRVAKGLTSHGYGDDLSISKALLKLRKCGILNLSLGCYTADNMDPPALVEALDQFPPETVIVAAAGNAADRRPFWPAALKRVIGVGALCGESGAWTRAHFSNYGSWVDACAPGVDLESSYVEFDDFKRWAYWSGTSFASPIVAAAIALVSLRDGISPAEAAFKLVGPSASERIPQLGVVVDPATL